MLNKASIIVVFYLCTLLIECESTDLTDPTATSFEKITPVVESTPTVKFALAVEPTTSGETTQVIESTSSVRVFCPAGNVDGGTWGRFTFPETEATVDGVVVQSECPFGFRNDGLESFLEDETMQTKDSKKAQSGAKRKCVLREQEDGSFTGEWQPFWDDEPRTIRYCKEDGWDVNIQQFNNIIEKYTASRFKHLTGRIVELLQYAYTDHECALALINGIDKLLRNPALGLDTITKDERGLVLNHVGKYSNELAKILKPGFKTQVGDGGIVVETAKFPGMKHFLKSAAQLKNVQNYATSFATVETTLVGVDISVEALNMAMRNDNSKDPQLKITAYSEDIFKAWNEESTTEVTSKLHSSDKLGYEETVSNGCEGKEEGNCEDSYKSWGALEIELDGVIKNLTQPIEFVISSTAFMNEGKLKCVYWDENERKWSTEGLESIQLPDGVKCRSTHLTAFSALIEPLPLPFPNAEYAPINNSVHSTILSILSSIGSVCSIVGLSFTLLTYGLFRCLRRERSNRILINLCFSLLLMHIMSVSGSKSLWDGHCFVPAASLHYLVLTSLAWMMVEAVHMYELLISVFVRPENRFLIKRVVLAWGIPLIIVGVCTALEPQVYTVGRADLCLMSAHENIILYYLAYIGPICIMLLVNVIIFVRIFRVLYQQTKRTNRAKNGHGTPPKYQFVKISPSQIKGATTVLVLLGIGWTIGLLAIGPFEVVFRYMYCVCNAGQGLFIFIFRVLLNPHASKQWKKVILGLSPESSLDVSFTTSASAKKRKSKEISPTFISAANSVENSLTASNPLSTNLATTLAAILRAQDVRAASAPVIENEK